jgi:hypothetical protein
MTTYKKAIRECAGRFGLELIYAFGVHRADIIVIPEGPPSLACEVVQGELLYAKDSRDEAEYQLYIMRRAADLAPYEHAKREFVFGKPA